MKTFAAVFGSSSAFGVAIAVGYWFVSHEIVGTLMLGLMAVGLAIATSYAILGERGSHLAGDEGNAPPNRFAGEEIGIFTGSSAWPPLVALCLLLVLVGVLWVPLVAGMAALGLVLCLWRMGAESNRV